MSENVMEIMAPDLAGIIALANANQDYINNYMNNFPFNVYRQAVINGGLTVNQRGVSGTVILAAGAYGHDRWKAGAAGCTYTFATVSNVTTFTITAGSLVQVIEGMNLYSGTYTLSWTGTAQGKIGAGSYGLSGIKSTVIGGTNLTIEFNTGTLSKVQFNAGDQSLPFQPRSFADEEDQSRRYCISLESTDSNRPIGLGTAYSTTEAIVQVDLGKYMRIIPTLVATASDWRLSDGATVTAVTSIALLAGFNSKNKVTLNCVVAAGLTQYRTYHLQAVSANKKMIFDAEL